VPLKLFSDSSDRYNLLSYIPGENICLILPILVVGAIQDKLIPLLFDSLYNIKRQ
jgi:hypothetical protein